MSGQLSWPSQTGSINAVNSKHTLGALISSIQEANGWSDQEVADRAARLGHALSKSNVGRVRNEPVVSIKAGLIQGLAAGLDIPVRQVVQAALQSMDLPGLRDYESSSPEDAIRRDPTLSDRDRRLLLSQLEVLRLDNSSPTRAVQRAGEDRGQRSAPMNPAGESPAPDDQPAGEVVEIRRRAPRAPSIALDAVADDAPAWQEEADAHTESP